ncbi:hypothetical protein H5410_052714 [Solanum commersonii]|uniref:Uncharacterized protein n=1 Tax=Solanum commersonii TaxID=4109 RepID=A0A9J5X2Y7_SOLCO|nr:hypothetical protein H5410_052714 [Solanum commersonii]
MAEKVDVVFNYGGKWVLTPQVNYIKRLTHIWEEYDPNLLSYIDLCLEYTEQLCFSKGDSRIKTLQIALSTQSSVFQLFVVEEDEDAVPTLDISQLNEPFPITVDPVIDGDINQLNEYLPITVDTRINDIINQLNEACFVTIDAVTDGESSENEPFASDHYSDEKPKNTRATQQALAHYFKNKVQNNPKYKVKDMRQDVDDHFPLISVIQK